MKLNDIAALVIEVSEGQLRMDTRRSHMVTRTYIAAWADERNVVDVLDLQGRRGYATSTTNATVVSYAYESEVMTMDLELEYARIESAGISAINVLRSGRPLNREQQVSSVAFLDMHLHRGRYADRADVRIPALLAMTDGSARDAELALGDMLVLSAALPETLRLTTLGLENWDWRLHTTQGPPLATGDGAVLLWGSGGNPAPTTITFPISPTKLIVIGDVFPDEGFAHLNWRLAEKCKRWIIGVRGTLNLAAAATLPQSAQQERE